MSLFFVHSEASGRVHKVEVPEDVKRQPVHAIFAWLCAEVDRREAGFPLPDVPGVPREATP